MDSKSNYDLSVVLPAYCEEENLRVLLPRLISTLEEMSISYEILVIDTQTAMDNTREVCKKNGVRYLNRQLNNNFGSAVRTGIAHATGQRTVFMDADGSHPPEFIPKLYSHIHEADVIIASRYVEGGVTENPKILTLMSVALNLTYSLVLGLRCKDVSNSFKLYRTSQLREFDLSCENFDVVEEILYKLRVLNRDLKIIELPFCFKTRMFGQTKRNLLTFIATYLFTYDCFKSTHGSLEVVCG